jgi:predicted HTH domain antitoxin
MKTLTIEIPDSLNLDEKEAKTFLAAKLYEKGSLSLGQAADMAGYTKRQFMELLSKYDVSIFNYSESELENDILNARNYHR